MNKKEAIVETILELKYAQEGAVQVVYQLLETEIWRLIKTNHIDDKSWETMKKVGITPIKKRNM